VSPGTLLVGQSGGPTAVINSTVAGILAEAARQPAISAVCGLRFGVEGLLAEDWLELSQADPSLIARLRRTPSAALGASRHRLQDDELERAIDVLRRHDVRYLVLIGGNDTADTTARLGAAAAAAGYPLQAIAAPKTIDNDLPVTDHCPGYGSAARYLAVAVQQSALDTSALRRAAPVKVVETMGREAGWVAAAAALGRPRPDGPPHLVYLPERPVSVDAVLADVEAVHRDRGYAVVVMSENQTEPVPGGGVRVMGADREPEWVDPFGHAYYASPAIYLMRRLRAELGLQSRYDRPGAIQRADSLLVSPVDEREAYAVGRAAVRAAVRGQSGHIVTLQRVSETPYRCTTRLAPVSAVANQTRLLPAEYMGPSPTEPITDAFRAYATPLLGGPLPEYARLLD
jgi:6-phosphofructokinase